MPYHLALGLGWPEVIGITAIAWILFRFASPYGRRLPDVSISDDFIVWLARGFDTGLLPKGPGTWGSLVGIVWFAVLVAFGRPEVYLLGILVGIMASVVICERAEKILHQHDPSSVVLDEIIALPICFLPWVIHRWWPDREMPAVGEFFSGSNLFGVIAVFGLFRLFDIWKPGPIGKIQHLPGGLGVTADDVLAGLATALVVATFLVIR